MLIGQILRASRKAVLLQQARRKWDKPVEAIRILQRSRSIGELHQIESLFLAVLYFSAYQYQSALAELRITPTLRSAHGRNVPFLTAYATYLRAACGGSEDARDLHQKAMALPREKYLSRLFI